MFNENRFSFFFVADHLLVGQLCTSPKSDRSLQSCLKVTQCLTCKIGNGPLYNTCSLPIQLMTIGPLPAPSKSKSGLPWKQGRAQGDENKVSDYGLWCGFKWGPHHATSHLWSRLEIQHQSVPECAEECGDPLVQSGGQWQTLGVAAGLGAGLQVQRAPGLALEGELQLCTLLSLASSSPYLNPLNYFILSYVENIANMTSHTTKASLIIAISRVFAEPPPALVEKAYYEFRIRIEAVIEAEGGYIE